MNNSPAVIGGKVEFVGPGDDKERCDGGVSFDYPCDE